MLLIYLDGDNDKNLTTLVYFASANYASVDASKIIFIVDIQQERSISSKAQKNVDRLTD